MADAEFQNIIDGLKARIESHLDSLKKDFSENMALVGSDMIHDESKGGYVSHAENPYMNRGSGGLSDPKNYEVTRDGMTLTVVNNTKGNPAYSGSDGWDSGYITDIIEGGSGYHWKNSEIYQNEPWPRPFMEETGDMFVDTVLIPTLDAVVAEYLGG